MAKIIFINKEFKGKEVELKRELTTVGRATDNLVEIHDTSVSAHHCEILHAHDEEVIVVEKDSKNGTFVDGVRVKGQFPIRSGQILRVGEVELRIEIPLREEEDTEITTILSLDKLEEEQRLKKERDAERTTQIKRTLGDLDNVEDETIIFQAPKTHIQPGASSAEAKYKDHEPHQIIPEPKSRVTLWMTLAVVIVVTGIILFIINRTGN